jgi:2-oxoglutarate ferredoxin oxidoreductase subunit beta
MRSPSSPAGSFEAPVSPCAFALGAGARFIARAIDVDKTGLGAVLEAAHAHEGASFVEIYQNCIVYNEDVFESFAGKEHAAERQLRVEQGKPMVFAEGKRGLAFNLAKFALEVVDAEAEAERVLIHDETNSTLAKLLLSMQEPDFPVALGVIYRDPAQSFEKGFYAAHKSGMQRRASVADAMRKTNTWWVG